MMRVEAKQLCSNHQDAIENGNLQIKKYLMELPAC
jgi:hypothetical protein